jgi:predicted nucleotidyltransferase
MQKMVQKTRIGASPTLDTILMVEDTLKKADDSIITVAELKRLLPRKVNHNTLIRVLEYLEKSNKIAVSIKGITWIYDTNSNVRRLIATGLEMEQDKKKNISYQRLRINEVRRKILPILRAHGVVKAAIFGSVARGEAKKDSDIDILVEFKETPSLFGLGGLYAELKKILGRRPDIVTYNSINSRIRQNIMRDKVDIL